MYKASLKQKWDEQSRWETAMSLGMKQGVKQGRQEDRAKAESEFRSERLRSAIILKKTGVSLDVIADSLGINIKDIEDL